MDLNEKMAKFYKENANRRSTPKKAQRSKPPLPPPPQNEVEKEEPSEVAMVIDSLDYKPTRRFDDLHGCEYLSKQMIKYVTYFQMAYEGKVKKYNKPILIKGSKGLGKSSLVEAAANYTHHKFITIPLATMVESTRNEFREYLKQIVGTACNKSNQPAVILIDDLNEITEKEEYRYWIRGAIRKLLSDEHHLLIFCTTSSAQNDIPGMRFSNILDLKRPTQETRYKILESLKDKNSSPSSVQLTNEQMQQLALESPSFTPLDLEEVWETAMRLSGGTPEMSHFNEAIRIVKRLIKQGTHLIGERPSVTWSDLGGMFEVRQKFIDILDQAKLGGKFSGIALYGPPGCGKTMVAKAMANEGGFNFISIKPSELVTKYLGETENNIRRVFQEAQEHEPCIIYFDEFDGLCGSRGKKDIMTSAIQTLLSEMDGFVDRGQSIVLVSTNRIEDIDPAMLREGRLSEKIYIGLPNKEARKDILRVTTKKSRYPLGDDVNLDAWARETRDFSCAALSNLVQKAELEATRNLTKTDNKIQDKTIVLRQEHFNIAMENIQKMNKEVAANTRSKRRLSKKLPDGRCAKRTKLRRTL